MELHALPHRRRRHTGGRHWHTASGRVSASIRRLAKATKFPGDRGEQGADHIVAHKVQVARPLRFPLQDGTSALQHRVDGTARVERPHGSDRRRSTLFQVAQGCPSAPLLISHRCQNRNNCGYGQGSRGSSGRSAHFHQTCRPAHRHRNRQARLLSPSLWKMTKPPDRISASQSGHLGEDSEGTCEPYPRVALSGPAARGEPSGTR